jgi:hypothetical protein
MQVKKSAGSLRRRKKRGGGIWAGVFKSIFKNDL